MLSISLGPVALPVAPLLLLVAAWVATALPRRWADAAQASRVERDLWLGLAFGLAASRLAHLVRHADAYLVSPWSMLDLRDGGWFAPAGLAVGVAWLGWRAHRAPALRRALGRSTLAGAAVWMGLTVLVQQAGRGAADDVVPDVTLTALDGGATQQLPDALAGRPAVVNLWATWCGPCRVEMPVLAQAQQRHGEVRFLFVNQGESAAAVQAYLRREGLALRDVWLDPGRTLGPAVGSSGLPTTLFFDAQGKRVHAHFGVLNAAALQARLRDLQAR